MSLTPNRVVGAGSLGWMLRQVALSTKYRKCPPMVPRPLARSRNCFNRADCSLSLFCQWNTLSLTNRTIRGEKGRQEDQCRANQREPGRRATSQPGLRLTPTYSQSLLV